MLIAAVKYLWKTGMKDIRKDILEYRRVCRVCKDLKKTKKKEYALLRGENGCIKVTKENLDIVFNNSDVMRDIKLLECEQENFIPCENLSASLCKNVTCPYFNRNKNYINACSKYDIARINKSEFWENKFMRVR